jgi:hypothetical protein
MKKVLSIAICYLLLACSVSFTTGCNQTPTEIVQSAVNGFTLTKTYVAAAKSMLPQITTLNPELAKEVTEYAALADANLDSLITIGNAWLAAPSGDKYQNLLNGLDALVANVDAKVLAAAKITNTQSQAQVLAGFTIASVVLHGVLVALKNKASSTQIKAIPKVTGRVQFEEIRQYLDREYARQELTAHGVDAGQVFSAIGL